MATSADDPVEITISEDKIAFIIIKAREFDAKVDPIEPDPGSNSTDEGSREILEDYDDDTTGEELRDAILGLDDDESLDLIALVWVGRGDFDRTEWADARNLARERQGGNAADYLLAIPLLADLIEEGYAALGHSISDVEATHL